MIWIIIKWILLPSSNFGIRTKKRRIKRNSEHLYTCGWMYAVCVNYSFINWDEVILKLNTILHETMKCENAQHNKWLSLTEWMLSFGFSIYICYSNEYMWLWACMCECVHDSHELGMIEWGGKIRFFFLPWNTMFENYVMNL